MINPDETLLIFANYKVVKGVKNAIILDIQKGIYFHVSRQVADFLTLIENRTFSEIEKIQKDSKNISKNYFKIFFEKNIIFSTKFPERFPSIENNWDHFSKITNSIVEIKNTSKTILNSIASELSSIHCEHIEIRFLEINDYELLYNTLSVFENSRIISIELILFQDKISVSKLKTLLREFPKVLSIFVFSSTISKRKIIDLGGVQQLTFFPSQKQSRKFCGNVKLNKFISNISFFTESLHHNSCLNRKISIDSEGNIKNCPSMKESFGNIRDSTLAEAIEKPGFKKYWNINKDKINVCKDCEFRYICTDCRAYVEDPKDILSKPLKCGYNPYSGEWNEWSTHPLKQKAIDFYEMREMVEENNSTSSE